MNKVRIRELGGESMNKERIKEVGGERRKVQQKVKLVYQDTTNKERKIMPKEK